MRFSTVTDALIEQAHVASRRAPLTKEQRLLLLMEDGCWWSGRELALQVSHRFGGYLHTLKGKGVQWEKREQAGAPKGERWWEYRLVRVIDAGRLF
jgi:hypothetical protein